MSAIQRWYVYTDGSTARFDGRDAHLTWCKTADVEQLEVRMAEYLGTIQRLRDELESLRRPIEWNLYGR